MYKRDIINFLFLISFSMYGIGSYIGASKSPSIGYLISATPFLLINVFYLLDILYKGKVGSKVNGIYYLVLLYLLSGVASLVISLNKGLPDITVFTVFGRSLLVLLPFPAFVVVYKYNRRSKEDLIPKLTLISLSAFFLVNLFGYYVLGLTNQGHNLEGRVNLPFFGGLYSAASMLVMMNLMLVWYMRKVWWTNPVRMFGYTVYFAINSLLVYQINSRLSMMIFVGVLLLIFFGGIRSSLVYWSSLFMIPLLLNLSLLVYQILTLPIFESVMQRVDFENVTTFSGRAYLWEIGLDWIVNDQRGLILGNGYQGQYFLGNLREIAMLWNPKTPEKIHFHSSSLEVMVNQGLIGIGLFMTILYKLFMRYREKYTRNRLDGIFFFVLVYLMFDLQVSSFVYLDGLGSVIFALLAAGVTLEKKPANVTENKTEDIVEMSALT
jgi:hypothetical protein